MKTAEQMPMHTNDDARFQKEKARLLSGVRTTLADIEKFARSLEKQGQHERAAEIRRAVEEIQKGVLNASFSEL